jgi:hypothetical protein
MHVRWFTRAELERSTSTGVNGLEPTSVAEMLAV